MSRMVGSRAYLEIIRLRFHEMIAHPLDLIGQWISLPLSMIILYVVYGTLYQTQPAFAGTTLNDLLLYLMLALVYKKIGDEYDESGQVEDEIKRGDIFQYLTRPIRYFGVRLSRRVGKVIAHSVIAVPTILLMVQWIHGTWTPLDRLLLSYFLALWGGIVIFQLFYIIGILSFWFEEIWGFARGLTTLAWLFSGSVIPLTLLPNELQTLSFLLPFQHQAAVSAQFTLGQVGIDVYVQSLLILLGWILVLELLQSWLWKKGLLKRDGKG